MPVLAYNPASRMAVMDGPLGPVETELAARQDWPLPVPLNELGRNFVKCFGDVPDSVSQAPCVIQTFADNLPANQSNSHPLRPDIGKHPGGRALQHAGQPAPRLIVPLQ